MSVSRCRPAARIGSLRVLRKLTSRIGHVARTVQAPPTMNLEQNVS
jgi:hypothetical protein